MGFCSYLGPDFKDKLVDLIKENFNDLCNNPSGFIKKVIDVMKDKISAKLKASSIPGTGLVRMAMEQTLNVIKTQAGLVAAPLQIALATPPAIAACKAGESDAVMAVLKQAIDTSFTKICGAAAAKAVKEENAAAVVEATMEKNAATALETAPVITQALVAQPMAPQQIMQQPMPMMPQQMPMAPQQMPMAPQQMMPQQMMPQQMMQQPMMQQPMPMAPQQMMPQQMMPQQMMPQQMMQQPMPMAQQPMMQQPMMQQPMMQQPMMQLPMPMAQQPMMMPMPMAAAAAGGKRRRYRRKTRKVRKTKKARKSRRTNLKA